MARSLCSMQASKSFATRSSTQSIRASPINVTQNRMSLDHPLSGETKPTSMLKRMLHGTGAGVAAHAIGIGSNLLLLPLYLHTWSVPVYGEWMALYAAVYYLGNLDF